MGEEGKERKDCRSLDVSIYIQNEQHGQHGGKVASGSAQAAQLNAT